MNSLPFDFEIADLGLVYYTNIIKNPQLIIDDIKSMHERFINKEHGDAFTIQTDWMPWQNESAGTMETFCWQKFIPKPGTVTEQDYYYKELSDLSKRIYDPLEIAYDHYAKELYPFAHANIKSREFGVNMLRYESGGFLPAHQDHGISSRVLSVVSYFNDDYEGGEIEFQNSDIILEPDPGSIVFFPSNFLYVHEVKEITYGTRYSLPHWYHNMEKPILSDGRE